MLSVTGPVEPDASSQGTSVIGCSVVFIVLCTLCLVLRFLSHHVGRRPLNLEDWLMIPSWFLLMGLCANVICSVIYGGVGMHEPWVRKYKPQAMTVWGQTLFVTELIYGITMALEKTSILLLYLRLFQIDRWFKNATYILIITVWMWGLSESLVAIFQCKPVDYQWNKKIHGTCISQIAYYRWVRVPNIIHDVIMLVLPVPIIWKLKLAFRQRMALSGIFVLGSFGCVASVISMVLFFKRDAFKDPTWASVQLMSWTLAEPGVIFICACLPSLWPLLVLCAPRLAVVRKPMYNRSNPYGNQRSNQTGGIDARSVNDDTVALNDMSNRAHEPDKVSVETIGGKNGINMKSDFSWEIHGAGKK